MVGVTLEEEAQLEGPTLDYRMMTMENSKLPSVAAKEPLLLN